jgi:two-component system cell cycle sensor histidine kinase/response regulator CckA
MGRGTTGTLTMAGKTSQPPSPQAAIAALPHPAIITAGGWADGGATIEFANPEFCELTGYTAAQLKGKHTRLLHGPRTDVAVLRQDLPAGRSPGGGGEGWLYRRDGSEFYAAWKSRSLGRGKRGPLLVVYSDRSDLWRQRAALLQAQKLGTVGLLASGVAHDFNNLLSIINGYCEIMEPKVAHVPPAHKDLQEIHRAGLKAAAIARQILEFSRRQETETSVVNFNTLIREITEIIRRVCGKAIEVELRLASDLGNARINPGYFQQVLLNLCFNARDAMPQGGHLTLRTCNQQVTARRSGELSAGTYVALQVIDTGIGLEPGLSEKIFEPFYTTKPNGTGLGLATAQNLIRQARGSITFRSTPGKTTTFEVLLPETAELEDAGITALGVLPAAQGTEAILVIEQDMGLRKMIAGILTLDGYQTTEAASVGEAGVGQAAPQLVIIDNATGPAAIFLHKLGKANPRLRVICTGPALADLPGIPPQAMAHLPKPFALSSLLTKARGLLDIDVK